MADCDYKYLIERTDENGQTQRVWVDDIEGLKGWKVVTKQPRDC